MLQRDILVVGASAGGVEALQELVSGLPGDLDASIFVVLHIPASGPSLLAEILQRRTALPVVNPEDGTIIERGRIYLGQPDRHLLIEGNRIRLTRGPKENRCRPSVDVLFRSVAYTFGARVIGIVLTGNLDDGTAGLWTVKQRGGTAVVQAPEDARHPSMPESALRYVAADHICSLAQMAPLLVRLIQEPIRVTGESITGHSFSIASLLAEITSSVEDAFRSAIRAVEESIMLLDHMARHAGEMGDAESAKLLAQKAVEAQTRADLVRQAAMSHEVVGLR